MAVLWDRVIWFAGGHVILKVMYRIVIASGLKTSVYCEVSSDSLVILYNLA